MRYFFILLLLITSLSSSKAQDTLRTRYGLFGGWSVNTHTADFRALPGVPNCCPQFSSGSGGGIMGGAVIEFPLAYSFLFSLSASYIDHSALLSADEKLRIIVNGSGTDGIDHHTVDATLSSVGIEPQIAFRPFGNFFISAGVRAAYLLTKSYDQKEVIDNGTFYDSLGNDSHSRIRNANSGTIPNTSALLLQGILGVRYELPLNSDHTYFLAPQVSYALSFTDVVDGLTWKPNGIRAGLGIMYSPKPEVRKRFYDTTFYRDTVTKQVRDLAVQRLSLASSDRTKNVTATPLEITEHTIYREHYLLELPDKHDLQANIDAYGLDDDGNEQRVATLEIEEFLSTKAHPLLGYIFFPEGDSLVAPRYVQITPAGAKTFRPEQLFGGDALDIHHNVLNIIGYRMKQYPNAKLSLTGCNSNQGIEENNTGLSQARVAMIKRYFMQTWGVAGDRISTAYRNLPEKPSNPRTPDGQEENRRVEITSDVPEVIDVFVANDTTRTVNPPQLRFKLTTFSSSEVTNWELEILQGRQRLKDYRGTKTVPPIIDWDLTNDQNAIPRYNEPLRIFFHVNNKKGDQVTDTINLPTKVTTIAQKKARKKGDVVIDRYNLVLFDFGKADITPAHRRIISMVQSKLQPTSSVLVEGYTDRSGSAASNKRLATSRAQSTSDVLKHPNTIVKGIGEDRLLYNNDTPEGRFYCRTVQITARTPVE